MSCHYHFEQYANSKRIGKTWDEIDQEADACAECQLDRIWQAAHFQWNETIDPFQPAGQHITLTCINHPDKFWTTKNIGYIGARSIFYHSPLGEECPCPLSDLRVARTMREEVSA
jgi:hypothetical protein